MRLYLVPLFTAISACELGGVVHDFAESPADVLADPTVPNLVEPGYTNNPRPTFTVPFPLDPDTLIDVRINDGEWIRLPAGTNTYTPSTDIPDGDVKFEYRYIYPTGPASELVSIDFKIKTSIPAVASLTITNSSPTRFSTYTLSWGTVSNGPVAWCLLENATDVSACTWTEGSLPASKSVSSAENAKVLSAYLKDAAGNISARVDSNSVTLDNTLPTLSFVSTSPAGPSSDSSPEVIGSTSVDTVTVNLFSNAGCTASLASGTRAAFVGAGITVAVSPNATSTLYGQAIDGAGNQSTGCTSLTSYVHSSASVFISFTVDDGVGTSLLNLIGAVSWTDATNPANALNRYEYAIGTCNTTSDAACEFDTRAYQSSGTQKSLASTSGVSLSNGTTYYLHVKAYDNASNVSHAVGNGFIADNTAASTVTVTDDGATTENGTQLSASWTASTDAQSGVTLYEYSIGTSAGNTSVAGWTSNGTSTSVTRTGLSLLDDGTTYYFNVRVTNGVSLVSAVTSSNGIQYQLGTNTSTGSLSSGRASHKAVLLQNGKVLISGGGTQAVVALNSAELYDPAGNSGAGSFSATGNMISERREHTMTLLNNGKVLVVGGHDTSSGIVGLASAELFDPAGNGGVGTFTATGSLNAGRMYHTATLLSSGKVLIAGGYDNGALSSAEIYDPNSGTFTSTGSLVEARSGHTASILQNGKVLLAAGHDGSNYMASTEIFNPAGNSNNGTFSAGPALTYARATHAQSTLQNGKVLITGGQNAVTWRGESELYDPDLNSISATGNMLGARQYQTSVLLNDGTVYLTGGVGPGVNAYNRSELFDAAAASGVGAFRDTDTLITGRYFHTATLLQNGKVLIAGGVNTGGWLSSAELYTPDLGTGGTPISEIAQGQFHTCAIKSGSLYCWGRNDEGQLGQENQIDSSVPLKVDLGGTPYAMTASYKNSCAAIDGAVKCWGTGNYGSIGDGNTIPSYVPVSVSGLVGGVIQLSGGDIHHCALLSDRTVKCWGSQPSGQLGDNSTTMRSTPVSVTGLSEVRAISAAAGGGLHTCAVTIGGDVYCWGENGAGQLGNGNTTNSLVPTQVNLGGDAAIGIAAGGRGHSCALMVDLTVRCWGWNAAGQLGNGGNVDSTSPVTVSGLTQVIAISAGTRHTCALLSDRTVKCWGFNANGELGNASTSNSNVPVTVSGLTNVRTISAAYNTCATKTDDTIACWGDNTYGQLGDNLASGAGSTTPVTSSFLAPNSNQYIFITSTSTNAWA
jgi:alpha-tubulin suppressor-like RCC1 family protein